MEWWQTFLEIITAFALWQKIIFYLALFLVGIFIGLYVGYLVIRFVYKTQMPFRTVIWQLFINRPVKVPPSNSSAQARKLPTEKVLAEKISSVELPARRNPDDIKVAKKPVELSIPGLLDELASNSKIASKYSGGKLVPLQAEVWDAHQYSSYELPASLREELEQVYSYIRLLNNLVWLATEGYSSSSLDEQYKKLLAQISERLLKIKNNIESGFVE